MDDHYASTDERNDKEAIMSTRERNLEMLRRRNAGEKPKHLAKEYGLTIKSVYVLLAQTANEKRYPDQPLTPYDRNAEGTRELMAKYKVPNTEENFYKCHEMTERAIRIYGDFVNNREYYEMYGEATKPDAWEGKK